MSVRSCGSPPGGHDGDFVGGNVPICIDDSFPVEAKVCGEGDFDPAD
ncbi:MAG: hypothetical protein AAGA42_06525 [Actinomycetota bacterium]